MFLLDHFLGGLARLKVLLVLNSMPFDSWTLYCFKQRFLIDGLNGLGRTARLGAKRPYEVLTDGFDNLTQT